MSVDLKKCKVKGAKKAKVAKCEVVSSILSLWRCEELGAESATYYASRKSAIHGARRFCKRIGFECEIVSAK